MDPGGNEGSERYELTGTLTGPPETLKDTWIRASGVFSGVMIDIKPDKKGRFRAGGLPGATYALVTYEGTRVLDMRSVEVPSTNPISISVVEGK